MACSANFGSGMILKRMSLVGVTAQTDDHGCLVAPSRRASQMRNWSGPTVFPSRRVQSGNRTELRILRNVA